MGRGVRRRTSAGDASQRQGEVSSCHTATTPDFPIGGNRRPAYDSQMSYEGRSPCKDVMRAVVMSAAMVSAATLEACSSTSSPEVPTVNLPEPEPTAVSTEAPTSAPSVATPEPSASAVRPRGNDTPSMPTRGFSGAARPRSARG